VCYLFHNAVSITDYIAVNDELQGICEEATVTKPRYSSDINREERRKTTNPESGSQCPRDKTGTKHLQNARKMHFCVTFAGLFLCSAFATLLSDG
jgi:hypothetical protein